MELSTSTTVKIAVVTSFILYYIVKSRRTAARINAEFKEQNVVVAQPPSFFMSIWRGKRLIENVHQMVQQYGKIFGIYFLSSKTIFIAEPELIQLIMSKEFTNFTNRRPQLIKMDLFEDMLFFVESEKWKRIRSIVTPTFSTGKLRQMKPRIDDTIETLLENIEKLIAKSPNIDVKELYGAYAMDTLIQVAFGIKVGSLSDPNCPIIVNFKKLFNQNMSIGSIVLILFFLCIPKYAMRINRLLGNTKQLDFFNEVTMNIIRDKREELKNVKNLGKASNFLEMLLEAEAENELQKNGKETELQNGNGADGNFTNKSSKFLSTDEMTAQCVLFFLAGFDTVSTTISLSLYSLALNPEIQEKLYEEIVSTVNKLTSKSEDTTVTNPLKLITLESLNQFEYLNGVINETLRLYPPASTERTSAKDITLEAGSLKVDIKKGDIIHFPVYSIHQDPEQFPEPERFNPERFIGEPTFHKYAYMPFGNGPRNCVARSLALFEVKMAVLSTVYYYKLSTCEQTKIPMEFFNNGSNFSSKDVTLKVEKR